MTQILSGLIVLTFNMVMTLLLSDNKYSIKKTLIIIAGYSVITLGVAYGLLIIFDNELVLTLAFLVLSWSYLFVFVKVLNNDIKTIITIMALSLSYSVFAISIVHHTYAIYDLDTTSYYYLISEFLICLITAPFVIKFINLTLKKIIYNYQKIDYKASYALPLLIFVFIYISRFFLEFTSIYIMLLYYITLITVLVFAYILITKLFSSLNENDKLSAQLHIDSLTKLYNRLGLYKDFEKLSNIDKAISVYFLDLDHLKDINDNFGHIKGDNYLKAFSNALLKIARENEKVYRISGDEFIIMSSKKSYDIDKLKHRIKAQMTIDLEFLGVSVGLATYLEDGQSLDELLFVADKRMYKDKQKTYKS